MPYSSSGVPSSWLETRLGIKIEQKLVSSTSVEAAWQQMGWLRNEIIGR